MRSVVASISVKPGASRRFEELFAQEAARVHSQEISCFLYQLCRDRKDETKYTVIELYADSDAVEVHNKTFAKVMNPELGTLFERPPEVLDMEVFGAPGLKQGIPGIAIVAEIPVKDSTGFEAAVRPLIAAVHEKEEGNLLYCFCKHPNKNSYIIIELYTGKEAIQQHGEAQHFKEGSKAQVPYVAGAPKITFLSVVGRAGIKPTLRAKL